MPAEVPSPDSREVKNAVDRVETSEVFARAPKLQKYLRTLGRHALAGTEPSPHEIGTEVFERPDDWVADNDPIVRVEARRLRDLLSKYYESDFGAGDEVLIELPKGTNTKLSFRYNPSSPMEVEYRLGVELLQRPLTRDDCHRALSHLEIAISWNDKQARFHASHAEAHLLLLICDWSLEPSHHLAEARKAAETALRLDLNSWHANVMLGAVCMFERRHREACNHFVRSFKLSPDRAVHPYYALFQLIAYTDREVALIHMREYTKEAPNESFAHAIRALVEYACGEYRDAKDSASIAQRLGSENWLAYCVEGLAWVALSREHFIEQTGEDDAQPCWHPRHDTALWMNWIKSHFEAGASVFLRGGARRTHSPTLRPYETRSDCLETLCPVAWAEVGEFRVSYETCNEILGRISYVRSFQRALAYVALKEYEMALKWLEAAFDENDPFVLLLGCWEVFECLEPYPQFRELVRRTRTEIEVT